MWMLWTAIWRQWGNLLICMSTNLASPLIELILLLCIYLFLTTFLLFSRLTCSIFSHTTFSPLSLDNLHPLISSELRRRNRYLFLIWFDLIPLIALQHLHLMMIIPLIALPNLRLIMIIPLIALPNFHLIMIMMRLEIVGSIS